MINLSLLRLVISAEIGLLALSAALLIVRGAWLRWSARRDARQTTEARRVLISFLSSPMTSAGANRAAAVSALQKLSPSVVAAVFIDLSGDLTGENNRLLRELADTTGLLRHAERMCHSGRWSTRLRGARLIMQLGAASSEIRRLLHDENRVVRTQAVEWATRAPSADLIEEIVELLAAPDQYSLFAVQDALVQIGHPAIDPLVTFIETRDGEPARAALDVASSMPDARFLSPALRALDSHVAPVRAAAACVLGLVGGEEAAVKLTERLADDSEAVRAEAAHALGRMRYWPASTRLASAMEDSMWSVRRAAAMALRDMGAPGVLQLRRMRGSKDRFASEMAALVLSVPGEAT